MPLTQNAPREPGCAGFGAILMTLPSAMVRSEPHNAAHSQQVLGTISVAGRFEGRTFIALSSPQGYTGAKRAQVGIRRAALPGSRAPCKALTWKRASYCAA